MKYMAVFMTASSGKEAEKIADALVDAKAAACVNIIPRVKSVYAWKGRKETSQEYLLIAKTSAGNFKRLKSMVKGLHSYDVPEIIGIPISCGNKEYTDWIDEVLKR